MSETDQLFADVPQLRGLGGIAGLAAELVLEAGRVVVPRPVHARLAQLLVGHHLQAGTLRCVCPSATLVG